MSDLRKQLIRLAHAKAELRPHLLPILKRSRAQLFIPMTPYEWGFTSEGPSADKAAVEMGRTLKMGLAVLEADADLLRKDMVAQLKKHRGHYDDKEPLAVVGFAISRRLRELGEDINSYFY